MRNIVLLAPTIGSGGIASWANKYKQTYDSQEFNLISAPIIKHVKDSDARLFTRIRLGINEINWVINNLKRIIKSNHIDILHTTTSGSLGTFRDYKVVKLCKKNNIRTILHCHYGSMSEHFKNKLLRSALIKTFRLYDQIWVLDKQTYNLLKQYPDIADKVKLTPNPIAVTPNKVIEDKSFNNFVFIGNLILKKGIIELAEAFKLANPNGKLHYIGQATSEVLNRLENVAGDLWGNKIIYHGLLPNDQAIEFLRQMDVLVLPTYYPQEAFPISILEAMSQGKLAISTPRAAIPDMLTLSDGSTCGVIVPEHNIQELADAMCRIQENTAEANEMCQKAYHKALSTYSSEIVYNMYFDLYRELLN